MIDGEDLNGVFTNAVDDSIAAPDDLSNILSSELGDNAPGFRKLPQPFYSLDDSLSNQLRVARRTALDEGLDVFDVLDCLAGPNKLRHL